MKKHYQEHVDDVFGLFYQHRTLRTLFDPGSAEWHDTTLDNKLEILTRLLTEGRLKLPELIQGYKHFYAQELTGKAYVLHSLEDGLAMLLQHALKSGKA